jgi:hypothetical protein
MASVTSMAVHLKPEERMRRGRSVRLHVIAALLTLLVLIAVNACSAAAIRGGCGC